MKKIKLVVCIFATILVVLAIIFVLKSKGSLVTHPKGLIAQKELDLIRHNYLLMLIVVVPSLIALFWTAWKYHSQNKKAKYDPDHSHGPLAEIALWLFPSIIIAMMSVLTWKATHELDPYKAIESQVEPLTIQVVALDWKWLFIYPAQEIATVNFVQFPEKTPIHLELSADGSPMNSFWIPELSGQIYSMTGMITQLHLMADGPGVYPGRAAEINGKGFADMTFIAKSTTRSDFDNWVSEVKQSPLQLTWSKYNELVKPFVKHPVTLYSRVEKELFNEIIMKPMHP